jgi:hypothetical protein
MAYTPQQAQQIIQQAQATSQRAQQLLASAKPKVTQTSLPTTAIPTGATTLTPSQQQQAASLLSQIQETQQKIGQLQNLYEEMQKYGVSKTEELPAEVQQKYGLTPTTPQLPSQVQVGGDIFSMISKIAEQQFAPIRSIMEQYIKGISQKYDDEYLKALQQRQQKEEEELIGEMSERGFDPGSGVTQAALNELRQQHQQEIQNLLAEKEQAISSAQLELAKLQQSGLTSLYGLVPELLSLQLQYQKAQQPQTITHETGIYSYDPTTNTVKQLIAFPTKDPVKEIIQDPTTGKYHIIRESGKVEDIRLVGTPSGAATTLPTAALQMIDEIKNLVTDSTVGLKSVVSRKIPGTQAYYLAQKIESLKSNIAFNVLIALRNLSKTGGALGQVSNQEEKMLSEALGALNLNLSPEQFLTELENVRNRLISAFSILRSASASQNVSTEDQWEKTSK